MDTLTHALTGAAISDSWFRRRLGPLATPFSLFMAALPDVDSFTFLLSAESAWTHHRGITHSFVPMLVVTPLFGYAGYRLSRRQGTWPLWCLLTVLCLFSHTILDLVTSWGTMPFLPFSNARVSWDVAPVLDVFVLALTGASFVANRVLRWERVDHFINPLAFPVVHRHPHRRRAADWVGKIVVGLVIVYLLVGWLQNRQTVRIAREELAKQGISPVEVRAMPIMFTYIAWHIAARDEDGAIYNSVYSSYAPKPMRFTRYPSVPADELKTVMATSLGSMFAWYTQGMYVATREPTDVGIRLILGDRRFFGLARPDESRFVTEFDRDRNGDVVSARIVRREFRPGELREEAERLWSLTWDGEADGVEEGEEPEETGEASSQNSNDS